MPSNNRQERQPKILSLVIERLSGGKVVDGSQRTCCVPEIKMREQTLVRLETKLCGRKMSVEVSSADI